MPGNAGGTVRSKACTVSVATVSWSALGPSMPFFTMFGFRRQPLSGDVHHVLESCGDNC